MKLLFSETRPDYSNYIFPYAVWAFPDVGETPADLFEAGFLPSSRDLDRFYLCRQVRLDLRQWEASSENRRILRKGDGLRVEMVSRCEFQLTRQRREFCLKYAEAKFGAGRMSEERLEALFQAPVTTQVLIFSDRASGAEVGFVTLYIEGTRLAYYYYSFYDLAWISRSLGMYLMTSTVQRLAADGFRRLYLGTCYSENALYKTQFSGFEFFNGYRWSTDRAELKFLLARQTQAELREHLLESEEYRNTFLDGAPISAGVGGFPVPLPAKS